MILKKHTVSPFAIALIFLGIWLALGMAINTSLYADNFEQFDWAHGMEIGYWKHPPITTWILIAFQSLAGVHVFNTYIVCFVCWAVTLYFYWRLARLLLPSHLADFALLLLSSTYMLTWRAQLFNHNVTLVMMTTITTWFFFRLMSKPQAKLWEWACLGLLSALAILSKYQSMVGLFGLLISFSLLYKKNNRPNLLRLAFAFCVFLVVLSPHLYWFYKHYHMISSFSLNAVSVSRSWLERCHSLLGFFTQQLRFFLVPLIISMILWAAHHLRERGRSNEAVLLVRRPDRVWLLSLVVFPIAFVVLMNQLLGMTLANHWGFGILLFVPMLLAWYLGRVIGPEKFSFLGVYVLFQLINLGAYYGMKDHAKHSVMTHQYDEFYPSQQMADAVKETWALQTNCPMKVISGPTFEAGIVSLYSGQYPAVVEFGDLRKSPWIKEEDLALHGYVVISHDIQQLQNLGEVHTLPDSVKQRYLPLKDFYWVNIIPKHPC